VKVQFVCEKAVELTMPDGVPGTPKELSHGYSVLMQWNSIPQRGQRCSGAAESDVSRDK
jgi:hypothetical protein